MSMKTTNGDPVHLSPREAEVGWWVLQGKSDVEISEKLGNAPGTVVQQRKSLYRRFGVSTRVLLLERLATYFEGLDGDED